MTARLPTGLRPQSPTSADAKQPRRGVMVARKAAPDAAAVFLPAPPGYPSAGSGNRTGRRSFCER
jgi:hypothetical protein